VLRSQTLPEPKGAEVAGRARNQGRPTSQAPAQANSFAVGRLDWLRKGVIV